MSGRSALLSSLVARNLLKRDGGPALRIAENRVPHLAKQLRSRKDGEDA